MFQDSQDSMVRLGHFLRTARKRRQWRQEDVANKLSISLDTVKRAESGQKGVSIGYILDMLSLFSMLESFNLAIDDRNDAIGISLQKEKMKHRVRLEKPRYDRDF